MVVRYCHSCETQTEMSHVFLAFFNSFRLIWSSRLCVKYLRKIIWIYVTPQKSILYFLIIYYEQWYEHFGGILKRFTKRRTLNCISTGKLMEFLTTYIHDVYHQSVVLRLLAILFLNWHNYSLFLKFRLSAVRNSKFQTAQEPIKFLDFAKIVI